MNIKLAAAIVAASIGMARPASAQVRASVHNEVASAQEIRGMSFGESPIVEPGASIGYKACDAYVSATYDTGKRMTTSDGEMIACTAGKLTLGATRFGFRESNQSEYEVSASIALGKGLPRIKAIRNFGEAGSGLYVVANKEVETKVGPVPLNLESEIAYNRHHYRTESGMSHGEVSAAVPINLGKLQLTPSMQYGRSFNGKDDMVLGITTSYRLR